MNDSTSSAALHVAVIMDGNGRWARRRGLPRPVGHRRGARAVRQVVEAAPEAGIRRLTLYAFSSDNWQRPAREVTALMDLLRAYLRDEVARCAEKGVRLTFIGRRDRLDADLHRAIERAERATAAGSALHVRIAVDYSARDAILRAATHDGRGDGGCVVDWRDFERRLAPDVGPEGDSPQVDLLIRTGGEQRLSDFLLWECAYAELYFTPVAWPDFGAADLERALAEFRRRRRRFGRVVELPEADESVTAAV
jgi:undecaprenyl diphosphate synthase